WDKFFKENLQTFFGADETDFNEDRDNPYQKVIGTWDSLKKEMLTGFGGSIPINFSVLKNALLRKMEANAKNSYSLSGKVSFSNFETIRAVPHKVICCIGMNSKDFPRQTISKEISIIAAEYKQGDKDTANEDRLMFLETLCSAKEALYISWIGQSEKTAEELDPSSTVIMLLKNLEEQYEIGREKVVVKHPLQPFSKKYYDGTLSTYDGRWQSVAVNSNDIWKWEVVSGEIEEKGNIENLYKVLSDVSKYFLRTVCNIELPEDIELLENSEPFVVEKGLEEWKLSDLILNEGNIKIAKLRGELPNGKFADKIIEEAEKEIEALRESAKDEVPGTFWIYLGKDKGKYRLKHWLYHLDLNLKKKENTKIFLKDKTITLPGMPREKAGEILDKLWKLKQELEKRILPIFPDAAWEYNRAKNLSKAWEKLDSYSQYAKMTTGNAESFKDLGIEEEFIEYSEKLFENYDGVEAKNAKT
ncbi:MAG: exodeoxyribonuclease V subunit gamma, partial [Candidatus Fibromonas sp.]|nr:exodeoxyribonuclease V subunit gamma [Candidatus Fibromonas sp.]